MSSETVFNILYAAVFALLALGLYRLCRTRRPTVAARAAEAAARVGLDTATAREIDELELIFAMPEATSGIARINQAIRDHEPEEQQ